MDSLVFEEIKTYVRLGPHDEDNLRSLAEPVQALIPSVVEAFYKALLRQPSARAVFTGGEAQIDRQRKVLANWIANLFQGPYDSTYLAKRICIGRTHLQVGLSQRFMCMGMELIWQELVNGLRGLHIDPFDERLGSLHKLLTLELTIMLESYKKSYSEQIRRFERGALEAKLVRAEHLAEIGQLAASLAHEIKNPLAGISGAIQIIGSGLAKDNPHRDIIQEIQLQISRMDDTVKDLLLYARPSKPSRRRVRLDKLVQSVLRFLREEPDMQRVRIELKCVPTEVFADVDQGQIQQLLINLVLNGAHASQEGDTIKIELREEDQSTLLIVRDYGCGMLPEVLEKAHDPFFTTKARGTGLGLAICKRIAESHDATMTMQSRDGEGTTVTVNLPHADRRESGEG